MPNLPTVVAQRSAQGLNPSGRLPDTPRVSGAAISGADPGVGAAAANLGEKLGHAALQWGKYEQEQIAQQREADVANHVAQNDPTPVLLGLRNQIGPEGAGLTDLTQSTLNVWIDEKANEIEDGATRQAFKQKMQARVPGWVAGAANEEFRMREAYNTSQANNSLSSLKNRVRADPAQYDFALEDGYAVIDAQPGIGAAAKSSMKTAWRQNSAQSRFEGLIENAKSAEELSRIEAELRGDGKNPQARDWRQEFEPKAYDQALDAVARRKHQMAEKAGSDAKALLGSMEKRTGDLVPVPDAEVSTAWRAARESGDPVVADRVMRVMRDQKIIRDNGRDPLPTLRQRAEQGRGGSGSPYPGLPPEVATAVNDAVSYGDGSVSPAYLGSTFMREYGGTLKTAAGAAPGAVDYGKTSTMGGTATGAFQFTEGTWLGMMKDGATAKRFGVDTAGKSDAELLDMRKDPRVSTLFAMALGEQNKRYLEGYLGRPVNDAELYMAHFLGGKGAGAFLTTYKNDPDAKAADVLPDAAAANKPVFYADKGKGEPLTVKQVYASVATQFGTEPTRVQYGDMLTYEKLAARAEKHAKDGTLLEYAREAATHNVRDLDGTADGYAARGADVRSVAAYNSVPLDKVNPLLPNDVDRITSVVQDGTADQVLEEMRKMQAMGGDVAKLAYKQIGKTNPSFEYAAGLAYDVGARDVARDVLRGAKRLKDNPDVKSLIGAESDMVRGELNTIVGHALDNVKPEYRQQAFDAAVAHYIETVAVPSGNGKFDKDKLARSVSAVLGGTLAEVRGTKIMLPLGVKADDMNTALDRVTEQDLVNLSVSKLPPRDANGAVFDAQEFRDEAKLRPVGGGRYLVEMADGKYAITGEADQYGRPVPYMVQLDSPRVSAILARGRNAGPTTARIAQAEDKRNPAMSGAERYKTYYPELAAEIDADPAKFMREKAGRLPLPQREPTE